MKRLFLFASLVLTLFSGPVLGASLEEVADGEFRATGSVRLTPEAAAERLFCKMSSKAQPKRVVLSGRGATSSNSRRLKIEIDVLAPGRRYRVNSAFRRRAKGFESQSFYTGEARGSSVVFSGNVTIDKVPYLSRFTITMRRNRIASIVETITPKAGGKKTTLVELSVRQP